MRCGLVGSPTHETQPSNVLCFHTIAIAIITGPVVPTPTRLGSEELHRQLDVCVLALGGSLAAVDCLLPARLDVDDIAHDRCSLTGKKKRVIVEVTPRWRAFLATQGEDWSTTTLAIRLENRWVRFTGWLFFDGAHDDESENTAPGRAENWRATAWEIHPVTSLRVCATGPASCE